MAHKLEKAAQKLRVKDGKDSWRVLSGKKSPTLTSQKAVRTAAGIAADSAQVMTAHKELRQKREHREADDLCDFFEAALTPFMKLFIDTDNFAKQVTGQWATVIHRDMFQMKICTKILVKAFDPKSNLFLVRKRMSCPLCCICLTGRGCGSIAQVEWGSGDKSEQNEWVKLNDIVTGRASASTTDCWLGIQAKAASPDDHIASSVCRRRCGTARLDGTPSFCCCLCKPHRNTE